MARRAKTPAPEVPQEKLLSVGEYAMHRNITTVRIYTLIRQGRIPKVQYQGQIMIPVERADACLKASQRVDAATGDAPLGAGSEETYSGNRAKREKYEAELKRLMYEQKAGSLVSKTEIETIAYEVARRTRDNLLAIPDRIAADVAAETDPQKVHMMITEALLASLNHGLSDMLKGTTKTLVSPQEGSEEAEPSDAEEAPLDV